MDQARWERIQALFHEALHRTEPEQASYLERESNGDADLLMEVCAMLEADRYALSILDKDIGEIAAHSLGEAQDSIAKEQFGPYRLTKLLGEGGMGVVWLAERDDLHNQVAVKFLPHAGLSPSRRERFAREIRTLAKLQHSYIARLYDAGALADGTPWFVMEYVEGIRLGEYCREPGRSISERLQLFRRVCEAVQYAHSQEIIHRDLKPSNIIVTPEGNPRLLDFGIARELQQMGEGGELTRAGLRFFTPHYSAPEWVRDGEIGFVTDVYSLGVVLYEMLSGQLPREEAPQSRGNSLRESPYPAEKPSTLARAAHRDGSAKRQRLSAAAWAELDVLCLKAMHPDPRNRYPSVEALIRDIDHYLKHEPLEARPDSLLYHANRFLRRNRVAVATGSLVLLAFAVLVTFFVVRLANARSVALAEAARERRIQEFMLELFEGGEPDAGPANDVHVVQLLDRGAQQARNLVSEPEVQADLNQTLGEMYEKLGQLDSAEALLVLSLNERRALPRPDGAELADGMLSLGLLHSDRGQWEAAQKQVEEAIETIRKNEPRNQLHLAIAESALGTVMVAAGKQAAAVPVLNRAWAVESTQGATPSHLARTINALADAQMYLGHYAEANLLYTRSLELDRKIYGNSHPAVSDALSNLGQLQEVWGHYPQAEEFERQALDISRSWYGGDHPDTARKMTALAGTLIYENHYSDAEKLLRKAADIQTRTYGAMHPRVAYVLNLLGSVANARRDFEDAERDDLKMAEIYRTAFGADDYRVAVALGNLGGVYQNENKRGKAEESFREALRIDTASLPGDAINTAITKIRLGRLLLRENRFREAEPFTQSGYETLLKQTSHSTSFVVGARHDLAAIYQGLHEPQRMSEQSNEQVPRP
jgi:eukaryotic-like serine/threonine-protein kinase